MVKGLRIGVLLSFWMSLFSSLPGPSYGMHRTVPKGPLSQEEGRSSVRPSRGRPLPLPPKGVTLLSQHQDKVPLEKDSMHRLPPKGPPSQEEGRPSVRLSRARALPLSSQDITAFQQHQDKALLEEELEAFTHQIIKSTQGRADTFTPLAQEISDLLKTASADSQQLFRSSLPLFIEAESSHFKPLQPQELTSAPFRESFLLDPHPGLAHPFLSPLKSVMENLQTLRGAPHLKGTALALKLDALREEYTKYADLLSQAEPSRRRDLLSLVRLRGERFKQDYFIGEDMAYKILSSDLFGLVHRTNPAGSSAVASLEGLHFKRNFKKARSSPRGEPLSPEDAMVTYYKLLQDESLGFEGTLDPGMEWAMYAFYKLLGKGSITPSALLLLRHVPQQVPLEGSEAYKKVVAASYPQTSKQEREALTQQLHTKLIPQETLSLSHKDHVVQVSQTVPGEDLASFLKSKKASLDPASFSAMVIASLLTNPADAKGDNFIVSQNHIIGIDNDLSLASMIVQLAPQFHYIEARNLLFCLPEMDHPLEASLRQQILSLSPHAFLLKWISVLKDQNDRYETLATQGKLNFMTYRNLYLPLRFAPQHLAQLLQKLVILKESLRLSPSLTHQEVFEKLYPIAALYYKTIVTRSPGDPLEAFGPIYGKAKAIEQILDVTHRLKDGRSLQEALAQETTEEGAYRKRSLLIPESVQELFNTTDLARLNPQEKISLLEAAFTSFPTQTSLASHPSWKDPCLVHEVIQHVPGSLKLVSSLLEKMPEALHAPHLLDQQTPLHYVLRYGGASALDLLTLLVTKGADLEQQGRDHLTPLDRTMEHSQDLPFAYLIQQGAGLKANSTLALKYGKTLKEDNPAYAKFGLLLERNPEIAWQMTLEHLLPLPSPLEKGTLIRGATLGERLLPDHLKGKLLTEKGQMVPHNTSGRHNVGYLGTRIQAHPYGIYFKEYPELPGLEEAVGLLTRALIGFGAPYSELFHIEGRPILASQAIQGPTLSKVLKDSPEKLQFLDSENLSSLILMAMLINPEDGKPDNYILEKLPTQKESYRLIGIDNDHAFVPAVAKEQRAGMLKGESKVQVKTILYSLDQMQAPVPSSVRDTFLKLNAGEILERWLRDLRQRTDQYNLLWPEEEKLSLVTKKECYIGVPFQKGAIEQLYQKLVRLQNLLHEKPQLTHLQLLCQLEPLLGHRYKAAFDPSLSVYQRFLAVDAPFYKTVQSGSHLTVTSSGMILKSMNIPLKESLLEKAKKESAAAIDFYPHTALKELKEIQQRHSEEVLFTLLKKAGVSVTLQKDALHRLVLSDRLAAVLKEVDFKDVSEPDQQVILDLIKGKSFQELILRNMKALTDKYITTNMIWDHLKVINLRGAVTLTETSLAPIAERVPALEQLNLSYILGLRSLVKKTLRKEDPILFPSLLSLNVSGCSSLESVRLEAPLLTHIKMDQCPQLQTLQLTCPSLKTIDLQNNSQLTDEKLDRGLSACPSLTGLSLQGCPLITEPDLRETYPWAPSAFIKDEDIRKQLATLITNKGQLELDYDKLKEKEILTCLVKRPDLQKKLGIQNLPSTFKDMKPLLSLRSLLSLDLVNKGITPKDAQEIGKDFPYLTSLNVWGNNFRAEGAQALASLTNLTNLNVGSNGLGAKGALALASLTNLTSLNVERNEIFVEGASELASLTNLTSLNMAYNGLLPMGADALDSSLTLLTNLTSLDVEGNRLGGQGMKGLVSLTNLTNLNLKDNLIENIEIDFISQNLTNLTSLDLEHNKISGRYGLDEFGSNLTNLTSLNLRDNPLDDARAILKQWKETKPNLKIFY